MRLERIVSTQLKAQSWIKVLPCLFASYAMAAPADQASINCDNCANWNQAQAPFLLFGKSFYVGPKGLSVVLIDSGSGLILIDAGLPQSVSVVASNLQTLGYKVQEIRYILNSHAHFDHAGGIAALARMSGATVVASELGAQALRAGLPIASDPQFAYGESNRFPAVQGKIKVLQDGETLKLGNVQLKMLATPGHTPGGSTWAWQSCEKSICKQLVFADSLTPVSAPDFRFTDDTGQKMATFRASVAKVAAMRCDLIVSAHPDASELLERAAAGTLLQRDGCIDYAQRATKRLDARALDEQATPVKSQ
jgi:metallo-beta-lactamase class B